MYVCVYIMCYNCMYYSKALAAKELALFDNNVRQSFTECLALDPSDANWDQAQLSLSHGGLGLRSLALHSPAAYVASLSGSGAQVLILPRLPGIKLCSA